MESRLIEFKVIGLTLEYYNYDNSQNRRFIIGMCRMDNKQKCELILAIENKSLVKIYNEVKSLRDFSYKTIESHQNLYISCRDRFEIESYTSSFFHFCNIKEKGFVKIVFQSFKPWSFNLKKQWIIYGGHDAERLHIATSIASDAYFNFETDDYDELPAEIFAGVIIIGDKKNHTLDDVLERILYRPIKVKLGD